MKKLFLITGLMFAFVGLAEAQLASPTLLKPDNAANLPLKKAAKFTWQKVTGASKYRLIFSNDKSFANYDANKFKCLNAKTCFLYTVASPSYNVAASHAMLKANGDYFWQAQSVGKTIADNSKKGEIRSFSVGTPVPPAIQNVSVNPQQITQGSSTIINATLDRALAVGFYTIKISIDGGESQAMTGSGTDFSFSYTPSDIGEQQFQIDIFDAKGEIVDSNGDSFTVIATIPVVSPPTPVAPTSSYSKIANNGSVLSDDAKIGANPTDWACTKDNKTGLIWEVKTTDGGLRDMQKTYTNYTADYPKCDWSACEKDYPSKYGDSTNTDGFVTAVNNQSLCGASDWRLPTKDELIGIVKSGSAPTIDTTYFPDFPDIKDNYSFWSSSPNADLSSNTWIVHFYNGNSYSNGYKYNYSYVRLVHASNSNSVIPVTPTPVIPISCTAPKVLSNGTCMTPANEAFAVCKKSQITSDLSCHGPLQSTGYWDTGLKDVLFKSGCNNGVLVGTFNLNDGTGRVGDVYDCRFILNVGYDNDIAKKYGLTY